MNFEHIKGKDNVLGHSILGLRTSGLYEANDPKELESEYGKSIFDTELQYVMTILVNTLTGNLKSKIVNTLLMRKI